MIPLENKRIHSIEENDLASGGYRVERGIVLEEAKQDDQVPTLPGGSEVSKEESLARFVGESESVVWMKKFIEKVAPLDKSVLITGASGVGKTLVAEIIHSLSGRSGKPLVKVNCASIPEGDFELALFGAEKDLSKGVEKDVPGKIEKARGGALLFNKICEMPLKVQGRLVSFFESKEVEKPGLEEAISADVRILATARRNLQDRISQGAFREDLYFGVNVMSIHVPPLIDRMKDLPELIRHLMGRVNSSLGTNISSISDGVLGILSSHDWPGNVRELQNVLERAAILSDGAVIKEQDARTAMREAVGLRAATAGPENAATMKKKRVSLKESLNKLEKDLILEALSKTRGIQVEAAEMLGLKPKNLWKKIQKHSIKFLRSEASRAQKDR